MPVVTAVGRRRGFAMPWVSTARSGAVMLANYSAGVCGRVSSPGLNVRKMCLKAQHARRGNLARHAEEILVHTNGVALYGR